MAAKKAEWTRCPHCTQRYGSEASLQAHVADHRVKYLDTMLAPEHKAVLDPRAHHAELKGILKRGGHGR